MRGLSVAFVLSTLLLPAIAAATTIRRASHQELVAAAQLVVVARAEHAESLWQGGRIVTRYDVKLEQIWKGSRSPGEQITVVTLGGVVDGIGQSVAGAPRLNIGKPVVLYLGGGTELGYQPIGLWQGVVAIIPGQPSLVEQDPGDSHVVGPQVAPLPATLDDLQRQVLEFSGAR